MQYDVLEFRIRKCVEKCSRDQDRRIEESERHWRCYVARNEQLRLSADTFDFAKISPPQLPLCWDRRGVCFQSPQLPMARSKAHQHREREKGPHDLECAQNPSRVNANQRMLNRRYRGPSSFGRGTRRVYELSRSLRFWPRI